jgi:peptidoglycan/LPS O-acetylase OafA/YrhL
VKKEHFHGLDSLRFFAALAVFFTHVELVKKFTGYGTHWIVPNERITKFTAFESVWSKEVGWLSPLIAYSSALGVVFFFVLSGFLITFLLLREKESFGKIQIKSFYIRRLLRIWPLYYLIFIVGFFVLPNFDFFAVPEQDKFFNPNFWGNFILYAFFMPNLAFSIYTTAVPNIGQSWSIGVEEQFYLVWPWIIKKSINLEKTLIRIIIFLVLIKALLIIITSYDHHAYLTVVKKFFAMSKLECMALGGLGAYYYFHKKEKLLKIVYKRHIQILSVILLPVLIFFTPRFLEDILYLVFAMLFMIIILNVVGNEKSFFKLRYKPFEYLGKISYGFYMFHVICIVFTLHMLERTIGLNRDITTPQHLLLYGISFTLSVVISSISYHIFEEKFIRLKDRFAQPKKEE